MKIQKDYVDIIIEAYGDQWDECEFYVDLYTGWCSDRQYNQLDCPRPKLGIDYFGKYEYKDNGECMVEVFMWIPKSLLGLGEDDCEDNNGWIKLDETNRCQYEDVWVCNYNGNGQAFMHDALKIIPKSYTHYQPINKPKPPLHNFTRIEIINSINNYNMKKYEK